MTTGTEDEARTTAVSRETLALIPLSAEEAPAALADAGAKAEALCWAPNTRQTYVAGWKDFASWCFDNRRPGLPAGQGTDIRGLGRGEGDGADPAHSPGQALAQGDGVRGRQAGPG